LTTWGKWESKNKNKEMPKLHLTFIKPKELRTGIHKQNIEMML